MNLHGLIIGCLCLAACSSPSPEKPSKEVKKEVKTPVEVRNLLAEYKTYLAFLDSTNEKSISLATGKYKELFSGSDQKLCDSAFVLFHKFYEQLEPAVSLAVEQDSVLQKVYWNEVERTNEITLDLPYLKKYEKKLIRNGYRLEIWEGNLMAGTDRSFLRTNFYSMLSPVMRSFLKLYRSDDDDSFQHDAGIIITEEEYVERLIRWETFIKKNPDFIETDRAKAIHKTYFTYFLIGMDNTPAINYPTDETGLEKMELDAYFVKAYDYLNKKYPDSEINLLVKPYKMTILKNDNIKRERLIKTYTKRGLMIDFSKEYQLYI